MNDKKSEPEGRKIQDYCKLSIKYKLSQTVANKIFLKWILSWVRNPSPMEANGGGIVPNGVPELPKNNLAGKCPVFNDEIVYTFELPSVFN